MAKRKKKKLTRADKFQIASIVVPVAMWLIDKIWK
ncbi:hypothetical protein WS74_0827 [Weissella ceti]|uniref:Uncharacterized protein n=1 Tax=Weissella ceti TaxID=759620 RepID=A0A088GME8_9LACO|nr:hypothetical protein WS74_0827 [Weissella ceti]